MLDFSLGIENLADKVQQQDHLELLQKLRKGLDHIAETEWQYDSIETHIGQQ